jgi:Domain of unknown function (DUF5655)
VVEDPDPELRALTGKGSPREAEIKGLEEHFRGRDPELRELFDELVRRLRKLGPIGIDPVKTSINLTARHNFGAVTVRGNFLRVEFLSEKRIADARIVHVERLGPEKLAHSVVLETIEDLDDFLMGWLASAYRLRS